VELISFSTEMSKNPTRHSMKSNFLRRALPILAIAIPATVHAHPGHGMLDFSAGAAHPILGADHLLAMVAVGLLGAQLGGRARFALPAAFVAALAVGAVAGASGFALPGMEHGIALSVLILGAIVAFAKRLAPSSAAAIAAVCGIFHGVAHGVEMPADATGALYGAGFVLATLALHIAGVGFGAACIGASRSAWVRCAGGAIAAFALGFFVF
jgi:urease accessory protein